MISVLALINDHDDDEVYSDDKIIMIPGNAFATLRLLTRGSVTERSGEYFVIFFNIVVVFYCGEYLLIYCICIYPVAGTWWTMVCKTSTTFSQTASRSQSSSVAQRNRHQPTFR